MLQFKLNAMPVVTANAPSSSSKADVPRPAAVLNVKNLSEYAWGQTKPELTMYVDLKDTKQKTEDQKTTLNVSSRGFELIIEDPSTNTKYIFNMKGLANDLESDQSQHKVSLKMNKSKNCLQAVVDLKKKKAADWWELTEKEMKQKKEEFEDGMGNVSDDELLAPSKDSKDPADLQKSLMGLMKKLYDQGDDGMKQQIQKTMFESMQKGKPNMM